MKKKIILTALNLAIASHSHAICVGTEQELKDALIAAEAMGNNEIDIRVGTYAGGFLLNYFGGNVIIRGGFTDIDCQIQDLNPLSTKLDGGGQQRPLTINQATANLNTLGGITISGLTFQNGSSNMGGGMLAGTVAAPLLTNVVIERNIFRNNTVNGVGGGALGGGLAVAATSATSFQVSNNLFVNNSAPNAGAAFFHANPGAFLFSLRAYNNDFVNNQSTDITLPVRAAVAYSGNGLKAFTANIFWGNANDNGVVDIDVSPQGTPAPTMSNNDIEAYIGTFSANSSSNVNIDPQFVNPSAGNFRPKYGSPLIDKGGQGAGNYDLYGNSRTYGAAIDIGAIETDYIFVDLFE